jgi:PQQ-like domain
VQTIPRGVADDGHLGVVASRDGVLVAIDARTGSVSWRSGRGLRPCAITAEAIVAVRADPSSPAVVVLDRTDGEELWSVPLSTPPPPVPTDPSSFQLNCAVDGDQVLLRWAVSSHYQGGAPPSPRVLEEHARRASGALRIDLRSRSARPVEPPDGDLDDSDAGPAEPAAVGPDVIQYGRLGDLRLELAAPPATGDVVLRAVDAASGERVWEVVVDEQARRRPPPLRP